MLPNSYFKTVGQFAYYMVVLFKKVFT